MSRSYRKSPVFKSGSDKFFKRKTNRKLRHGVHASLHIDGNSDAVVLKLAREVSNVYCSFKDGQCKMFGGLSPYQAQVLRNIEALRKSKNPRYEVNESDDLADDYFAKLMRK